MDLHNPRPRISLYGMISSIHQALQVVTACIQGSYPLIINRLTEMENKRMIGSGNIFVFVEQPGSLVRWFDRKCWTPSRMSEGFTIYRECEPLVGVKKTIQGGLIKRCIGIKTPLGKMHLVSYYRESDLLLLPSLPDHVLGLKVPSELLCQYEKYYAPREYSILLRSYRLSLVTHSADFELMMTLPQIPVDGYQVYQFRHLSLDKKEEDKDKSLEIKNKRE